MKTGLSATKFIKNNKRTCGVLLIALSFTFMAMYVVNFLLMTTKESFETVMLKQPKKVCYINPTDETLGIDRSAYDDEEEAADAAEKAREEFGEKLKSIDGISEVYYTQIINSAYQGIVGQIYSETPLLEKEQIQTYLDHMGAKLIDGHMPSAPGEVLVDSVVMKNQGYEIGGTFMEKSYGKTFTVAGVIESDYMACVGIPNKFTNNGWYHVILTDDCSEGIVKLASAGGITISEKDEVIDYPLYKGFYKTEVKDTINGAVDVIVLVILVFLAVSVIVSYVSYMRNRLSEYCLYASLGYSKSEIYGMIMREMAIIFLAGAVVGALLSIGLMFLMDICVIAPQGLVSKWFYPAHVGKMAAAFCMIIGLLQLPVLVSIHSIKTIDMLED